MGEIVKGWKPTKQQTQEKERKRKLRRMKSNTPTNFNQHILLRLSFCSRVWRQHHSVKAVHSYKCGKKWQKLSYVQVMELCAGHHKNNNNDNKNEDNEKHLQQQQQQSCTSITTKISLWLLRSNTKYFPMVRGCCFWWQKWSTMVKADRWVQKITQGEKNWGKISSCKKEHFCFPVRMSET